MVTNKISIKNAKENNLKNISLKIPKNELVVITGVSGSGKSSLAFNTIYAEGQRRYIESLSSYARQFLNQMPKANVEKIDGLSPTISVNQKSTISNPRSLVSTTTEIHNYLRILYSSIGKVYCPKTNKLLKKQSPQDIVNNILNIPKGKKILILSPIVKREKGTHKKLIEQIFADGFNRLRVNKSFFEDSQPINLDKNKYHSIEIVVDRLKTGSITRQRLTDSVELSLKKSKGELILLIENEANNWEEELMSEFCFYEEEGKRISLPNFQARHFSFNSPYGACKHCHGLGEILSLNEDMVIPNKEKPLINCVELWNKGLRNSIIRYYRSIVQSLCQYLGISELTPYKDLSKKEKDIFLYGTQFSIKQEYRFAGRKIKKISPYEGVIPTLLRRYKEAESERIKKKINPYLINLFCPQCKGQRLNKNSLLVKIKGKNIADFVKMNVSQALDFINKISSSLSKEELTICIDIIKEIQQRLSFLNSIGLSYLSLDRKSSSLSGGEAQRIRLATQLGNNLVGVIYVLDEPSIGLHQKDNDKLITTLKKLRDKGNSIIVVEHDIETIKSADTIIELGKNAGENGGKLIFNGTIKELLKTKTKTANFLSGHEKLPINQKQKISYKNTLHLEGAKINNLKNISVSFPLNMIIAITGVFWIREKFFN